MTALACEELAKDFGGVTALSDVSFTVEEGELFGFLGPNGAGKTTTVNIFSTLLPPSYGWAEVAGFDVECESDEVRDRIGLVFQDQAIDGDMTAEENLLLHAVFYGARRKDARPRADYLLGLMELADRRHDKVQTFSGGMRRRLEIARCMMHNPQVLFLDEPTAGLDPHARALVWELLEGLRTEHGVTLFLTTHYLAEAERCNRLAIVDGGSIVTTGTPQELKATIGADVVQLRTANDALAVRNARERLGMEITESPDGLRIHAEDGPSVVPKVCAGIGVTVESITVSRPSLDDVFLHYTGRSFHQETEVAA